MAWRSEIWRCEEGREAREKQQQAQRGYVRGFQPRRSYKDTYARTRRFECACHKPVPRLASTRVPPRRCSSHLWILVLRTQASFDLSTAREITLMRTEFPSSLYPRHSTSRIPPAVFVVLERSYRTDLGSRWLARSIYGN
ncbi:hypothetical protein CIRG_07343 [Coccidioides immitis RMSCC 2394]|uniref:Uncharacterized protein n=1 Tax=Coccidioides immitis RMSCC 2394 TaxID=404692 RepID=A0A0J6YL61_COCIT|nr:hypothetical protein CIRG_07343 [Coccidioides immitis RMSCC 2394]